LPKRAPRTIAEAAVGRGGFRTATKALTYLALWGTVFEDLGRAPTMPEYVEWWGRSRATCYREKQAFEKCFPGVEVETMWAAVAEKIRTRGQAAALELGGLAWS
jgi:hypothetical protein